MDLKTIVPLFLKQVGPEKYECPRCRPGYLYLREEGFVCLHCHLRGRNSFDFILAFGKSVRSAEEATKMDGSHLKAIEAELEVKEVLVLTDDSERYDINSWVRDTWLTDSSEDELRYLSYVVKEIELDYKDKMRMYRDGIFLLKHGVRVKLDRKPLIRQVVSMIKDDPSKHYKVLPFWESLSKQELKNHRNFVMERIDIENVAGVSDSKEMEDLLLLKKMVIEQLTQAIDKIKASRSKMEVRQVLKSIS